MKALALVTPLAVALVLAAPAADEPTKKEFEAAAAALKDIGLAFHAYCDEHDGRLPDDIADKDGRFVLSWRVALLPYLEEGPLYKRFKLDEPWDSENNKPLAAKMPKVYAPARGPAKAGETYYQRFVGKDTLWPPTGAYRLLQIQDGTSNTALAVEAGNPVGWTQPTDLPFNAKLPLPGLGGVFGGDFHVLLGDGSVHLFKRKFDQDAMKLAVMPDDGQPVPFDSLLKK